MRSHNYGRYGPSICAGTILLLAACGFQEPLSSTQGEFAPQVKSWARHVRPAYGVIYDFQGYPSDGSAPYSGLINVNGTLYGTTISGGSSDNGTAFEITSSGEKVYYPAIYRTNGAAGKIVGTTLLDVAGRVHQYYIDGNTVVAPDSTAGTVGLFKYPAGGPPIKSIAGFEEPIGSAVSLAK